MIELIHLKKKSLIIKNIQDKDIRYLPKSPNALIKQTMIELNKPF